VTVKNMTHDQAAEWIAARLRREGYPFAFANMTSASHGEQPDVLAMNSYAESIVVEVKMSRADFRADAKKPWRKPGKGVGLKRVYLTPQGLLDPAEVPYGWLLWEIHGVKRPSLKIIKGKVMRTVDSKWGKTRRFEFAHCDREEYDHFSSGQYDFREETSWLLKILRRAMEDGVEVEKYSNRATMVNAFRSPGKPVASTES